MTPFGEHMRFLRLKYNKTLIEQANKLTVSAAYLSALEHGKRGKPSPILIDQICVWLGLIWMKQRNQENRSNFSPETRNKYQ